MITRRLGWKSWPVVESAARDFADTMSAEDYRWFLQPFLIRAALTKLRDQLAAKAQA